jgi:hypothetical protein
MAQVLLTWEHVLVSMKTCLLHCCLATDNFSGPTILAFDYHIIVLSVYAASHGKASLIHIAETNVMDNT